MLRQSLARWPAPQSSASTRSGSSPSSPARAMLPSSSKPLSSACVPIAEPSLPRLRQAVVAARNLEAVTSELRERLGLGEPYQDPAVEYFGLRNAVFALGDTFLEVVSPVRSDAAAARQLERRG